jgi:multiple sugar transport system ATP-binding protein
MQVGTPKDIYDNPNNIFVAGFIGTPPMNFIHGTVDAKGLFTAGQHTLQIPDDKFEIVKENRMIGKEITLGIRPEDIHDNEAVMQTYPNSILELTVDVAELLGAETNIYTAVNDDNICASVDARADIHIGNKIKLALDMNKCHFFDPETEQRLVVDINELIQRKAATIENVPKSDEGKV